MILALMEFHTPWLLLGLLAAAIPVILHLLSSVRAQEYFFPTLRFLKMSMEKTARRRRVQNLLLMLLRMALLALLAMSVAEPFTRASGGWLSGRRYAAAVILDNSMSMATQAASSTRFAQAKTEASAILSGPDRPEVACLLTTNGGVVSKETTASFESLRMGIEKAVIGYGVAPIGQRLSAAVEMLEAQTLQQKCIYVLSDLQKISFDDLSAIDAVARAKDLHLFLIHTGEKAPNNVGISNLEISGRRVVDSLIEFTATIANSSPTDKTVDVALRVEGSSTPVQRVKKTLTAAGKEGSTGTVRFRHRFNKPGPVVGEVVIEASDDLPADNVRRFCMDIGGRVKALVVTGPAGEADSITGDPSVMVRLALDPYGQENAPWPITMQTVDYKNFAAANLAGIDAVYLCDVPAFSAPQAQALEQFAKEGGTVLFFAGPNVQAANYNDLLVQKVPAEGGLLPARLGEPVGQVGPEAPAKKVEFVDVEHPFFGGLFENRSDYLSVLIQRHYTILPTARPSRVLMRMADGSPLLLEKGFGQGRVLLCTSSASATWSTLPISGLFLPLIARTSLLARQDLWRDNNYLCGAAVVIRPRPPEGISANELAGLTVKITLPETDGVAGQRTATTVLKKTAEGVVATFEGTSLPGVYAWQVASPKAAVAAIGGKFVANPNGKESLLQSADPQQLRKAWQQQGVSHIYIAPTLAAANASASAEAEGDNWWDKLLVLAVLALVGEAVISNRFRKEQDVPAHLNPKIA